MIRLYVSSLVMLLCIVLCKDYIVPLIMLLGGGQRQAFLIILEEEIEVPEQHNRPILEWREGQLVECAAVIGRECDLLPVLWRQTAQKGMVPLGE
jgi:hypothetical protein